MLPRIDKERDNGLFAKSFGCFQPVQTLDKYEAPAVRPNSLLKNLARAKEW